MFTFERDQTGLKIYRTSLNVASQRAVRPSTSVSATGNAADFLARYREGDRLVWPADDGMRGNRQLPPGPADQALELDQDAYAGFLGPTLAREARRTSTDCSGKETVRRIMAGWLGGSPAKQRAARIQPRYRRPCTGELIQIDGCDHDWFERLWPGLAPRWSMLDDAKSSKTRWELLFVKSESTFSLLRPRGAISISMVNRWQFVQR